MLNTFGNCNIFGIESKKVITFLELTMFITIFAA